MGQLPLCFYLRVHIRLEVCQETIRKWKSDTVPGDTDTVPGDTDIVPGDTDLLPGDTDTVPTPNFYI